MNFGGGIWLAVTGAIVVIVGFAVLPELFGQFGNTYNLAQDGCVAGGERFTYVNTVKDWTGTDVGPLSGSGGGACGHGDLADATTYYTPMGTGITTAAADALPTATAKWDTALEVVTEQGSINRLLFTALPLLAILGFIGLLYNWHRPRSMG